jgi:hypothetical protein
VLWNIFNLEGRDIMGVKTTERTHAELLDKITYFPETGEFVYNRNNKVLKYKIEPNYGFRVYSITGFCSIAGHNLAYWYMKGEKPPKHYIRFRNGDKTDTRWNNLYVRDLKKPGTAKGSKQGEAVFSKEDILKLLRYDAEEGKLYWKERDFTRREDKIFNTQFAGKRAGCKSRGYIKIRFFNSYDIYEHRLVWMLETGQWPTGDMQIDHINHVRDDNRFVNLRLVTNAENSRNMKQSKANTSGRTGVKKTRNGTYCASIYYNYECILLGFYKTFEEAVKAREEGELKYNYHDNHGDVLAE